MSFKNASPILIGLAGQSCSGKNTAAKFLLEKGFFCIDADEISREVFNKNQAEIFQLFKDDAKKLGFDIVLIHSENSKTITLNKKEFAMLVFSNKELLKRHENFILPKIEDEIDRKIQKAFLENCNRPILLNAPTLHKTKFVKMCKFILYIKSPFLFRFLRAKKRDKLPAKNILIRFSKQKDFFSQYLNLNADTVIVKNFIRLSKFKARILEELKKRGF